MRLSRKRGRKDQRRGRKGKLIGFGTNKEEESRKT